MTGHEYLKNQRLKKGLTLRDVENASKVSFAHVGLIEKGKRQPTFEVLVKLLDAYGVPMNDFMKAIGYTPPKREGRSGMAAQGFEPRTLRI